jgi:hypothetical protein
MEFVRNELLDSALDAERTDELLCLLAPRSRSGYCSPRHKGTTVDRGTTRVNTSRWQPCLQSHARPPSRHHPRRRPHIPVRPRPDTSRAGGDPPDLRPWPSPALALPPMRGSRRACGHLNRPDASAGRRLKLWACYRPSRAAAVAFSHAGGHTPAPHPASTKPPSEPHPPSLVRCDARQR